MTTPSKAQSGGESAAAPTTWSTGTQSALELVDQLLSCAGDLKRELRGYGDANTVGRDVQQLRSFLDRIHRCEVQIAQSMGISWQPGST